MKLVTFETGQGSSAVGAVVGAEVVDLSAGLSDEGPAPDDIGSLLRRWPDALARAAAAVDTATRSFPLGEARLLTPVTWPRKIIAVAANYRAHMEETKRFRYESAEHASPWLFQKPITSLIGPNDEIVLPELTGKLDWEAEIGVVIGAGGSDIPESSAMEHVAGYTVVNDISAREIDVRRPDEPRPMDGFFDWLQGKWFDTSCVAGPAVLTADEVDDWTRIRVGCDVNGVRRQDATAELMIFPIPFLISYISRFVTLEPGDLIATGTPSGVGKASGTYLAAGDVVTTWVENVGELVNPVVATRPPA